MWYLPYINNLDTIRSCCSSQQVLPQLDLWRLATIQLMSPTLFKDLRRSASELTAFIETPAYWWRQIENNSTRLDETKNLHSINSRIFTLKWWQFPTKKRDRYIHMKSFGKLWKFIWIYKDNFKASIPESSKSCWNYLRLLWASRSSGWTSSRCSRYSGRSILLHKWE